MHQLQPSCSINTSPSVHFRDPEDLEDTNDTHHKDNDLHPGSHTVDTVGRDPEDLKLFRTIPTTVVPIYRQRMVLLKIGDNFLRIGTGSKPTISKTKPPLYPPLNEDEMERLWNPRGPFCRRSKGKFQYQDFTFFADESASITESWYHNAIAFFHIRLAVKRRNGLSTAKSADEEGGKGTETEYLCATVEGNNQYDLRFDKQTFGSWWRITALSHNQYVAESVQFPGRCLTKGRLGLCLCPPLTERERSLIIKGNWDKARTLSILTLPDFAARQLAVTVN